MRLFFNVRSTAWKVSRRRRGLTSKACEIQGLVTRKACETQGLVVEEKLYMHIRLASVFSSMSFYTYWCRSRAFMIVFLSGHLPDKCLFLRNINTTVAFFRHRNPLNGENSVAKNGLNTPLFDWKKLSIVRTVLKNDLAWFLASRT